MIASLRTLMRHRWALPAAIFLLVAFGSLSPDSYFLHFDTPTVDVTALELSRACWESPAATLGPMLLMSIPYLIFGANPLWQMIALTLLGAVMAAALFRITERMTGSARWALIAALWFISLPTILYYTRMHLGFPLTFFVLGLMLYMDQRWAWSGISFGLAALSHFNFSIPIAVLLIWATLLVPNQRRIRTALVIASGIALTFVAAEIVNFLFTGIVFKWTRDVITDAQRLSDLLVTQEAWPITHLIRMMAFSNGWLNAALLMLGILYPIVRKPRVPLMDAIFLSGWCVFGYYSVRIATGNTFLTPRMFSAVYPLFVITSVFAAARLVRALPAAPLHKRAAFGMVALLIAASMMGSTFEAAKGSRTGYEGVDQAFQRAAQAGYPVRYLGNFHVAQYFGVRYGVETGINEDSIDILSKDTRAVLIFEAITTLPDDPRMSPDQYEIALYPHTVRTRPSAIEEYGMSPKRLDEQRQQLDQAAGSIEIWWPKQPAGQFQARTDEARYIFHYSGDGCINARPFSGRNFYDVIAEKAQALIRLALAGDFQGLVEYVKEMDAQ